MDVLGHNIIEEIRTEFGLTYRVLESLTGLGRSVLCDLANGKRPIPKLLKIGFAEIHRRLHAMGVAPKIVKQLRAQGPQTITQLCKTVSARRRTIYAALGTLMEKGMLARNTRNHAREPFIYKLIGSGAEVISEDDAAPPPRPSGPRCPDCGQAMLETKVRSHFFHGALQKCWRCPTDRKFRIGLRAGGKEPFRLDRAINPNTGQEVPVPIGFRRKRTSYERRYGWVWCDVQVGRGDGCGRLCRPEGRYSYEGRKYAVFACWNRDCNHYRKTLNCFGGKVWPRRVRQTSLPPNAQTCRYCKGPNHRCGRHKQRDGLLRVQCGKCGRIQYFDMKRSRLIAPQRSGRPRIDDPNRPNCIKCERRFKAQRGTHVRLFRLTRRAFRRVPTLCPSPVRLVLEKKASGPGNQVVAVHYECKCGHVDIWKSPMGEVIWARQPGEKLRLGYSFRQFKKMHALKVRKDESASQTETRKHLPAQEATARR